jgi:hypothetical protein
LDEMARLVATLSGNSNFIRRYSVPKRDWLANEQRQYALRQKERVAMISRGVTNEAALPPVYVIRPKPRWLVDFEKAEGRVEE